MTQLLTPEVRAALGTTVTYVAPEPLSRASIRYFALAIGADPQRWRDEAPPTLICETAQLTGRAVPDGNAYLGHAWDLPLPVRCAMIRGGNDYRFDRPARFDDVISTTWTLTDATERLDREGHPLLFVTAEAAYSADGDSLATNAETMIFRPLEAAQPESDPPDEEAEADAAQGSTAGAVPTTPTPEADDPATVSAAESLGAPAGPEPLPRERLRPGPAAPAAAPADRLGRHGRVRSRHVGLASPALRRGSRPPAGRSGAAGRRPDARRLAGGMRLARRRP